MKTLLLVILAFLVGAGLMFGYFQYSNLQNQNKALLAKTTPIPTPIVIHKQVLEQVTTTPAAVGTIKGSLSYPGEGIPPLTVYAFTQSDHSKFFFTNTAQNVATFTIENVPPGTYVVVAYPDTYKTAGGYTKAVACGLSVDCKDHSLIPVTVTASETASGVEVKDWYAPDGAFPPKP